MTAGAARRLPTFFLAGVSKAGTTSLRFYLDQHPQVFMSPIKEPTFFGAADLLADPFREGIARAMTRERDALRAYLDGPQPLGVKHFVLDWEDYLKLFRRARHETAIGEASTGYFWLPSASAAIRAAVPDARLVFVLRHPVERLQAFYELDWWREPRLTFPAWFRRTMAAAHLRPSIIDAGRYALHFGRFVEAFPREQLRVYLYEDYQRDARAVVGDVFQFVGVSPDFPVDVSQRYNETVVPRFPWLHALRQRVFGNASATRWLPVRARRALQRAYRRGRSDGALDPGARAMVIDYYRDEIVAAADLIGRDLSAWLR